MKQILKPLFPKALRKWLHQINNLTRRYWYKGDALYCICCDGNYRQFLDMTEGSHPRKGVICPGCGSVERHRMLLHYLKTHETDLFPKGARILYIAPMQGIRQYFKQLDHVEYVGADLESSLAEVHFNLEDIPYPESSFDFCICSHTLAHVKNDQQALSELNRVLSRGGKLLVLERQYDIPKTHDLKQELTPTERLQAYHQPDRWRIYGHDLGDYLALGGFDVKEVAFAVGLDVGTLQREVLDKDEVIFICTKK